MELEIKIDRIITLNFCGMTLVEVMLDLGAVTSVLIGIIRARGEEERCNGEVTEPQPRND